MTYDRPFRASTLEPEMKPIIGICLAALVSIVGAVAPVFGQCLGEPLAGSGTPGMATNPNENSPSVFSMKVWDPDGAGPQPEELVVGGRFVGAFGVSSPNIIAWNGTAWHSLGAGVNNEVRAMTVFDGELIAGGYFTSAGGASASYVAAWNGIQWRAMGTGFPNSVQALVVYGGVLFAATQSKIWRWDGTEWIVIADAVANALTVFDGELVAGGTFNSIGAVAAPGIAAWNGQRWRPLGSSPPGTSVYLLAEHQGRLIAAGGFTSIGGVPAWRIASWDGIVWRSLGSGLPHSAYSSGASALATYHGDLIVGGDGTTPFHGLARWNDLQQWQPMPVLLTGYVLTLASFHGDLCVGGYGNQAGESPYAAFFRWSESSICSADFDCSGSLGVEDVFAFLNAWFAADPRADFNRTGGLNVLDVFDFVRVWYAGCNP